MTELIKARKTKYDIQINPENPPQKFYETFFFDCHNKRDMFQFSADHLSVLLAVLLQRIILVGI